MYLCSVIKNKSFKRETHVKLYQVMKTYDVIFNDSFDSNSKGIHGSIEECMNWIDNNRSDKSTYFGDYVGGTVSIVCEQTGKTVYEETIE